MNDKLRIGNPYPGPRFFKQEEEKMFFGREREKRELQSLLIAHRVVLLYSKSGAGKTSLMNAGVIPSLIAKEGFEVLPVARVKGLGREAKEPKGMENRYVFNVLRRWAKGDVDSTKMAQMSLPTFLKKIDHSVDKEGLPSRRLVILDQFEELFTFDYLKSREDRNGFFRQVAQSIQEDDLLRVLFVIREDYLANLDPYIELLPELLRSKYRLERLREDAACLAVEKPLEGTDRMFASGAALSLVQKLLAGGEYVEPLQLQVVCRYLWDELDALEEKTKEKVTLISSELLDKIDVGEALKLLYEQSIEAAKKETGVKEGDLRNWFDCQLITSAGTRGTVFQDPVSKECSGGIPNSVVKVLEDNNLIRAEERAGAQWYELTHDLLIDPIKDSNKIWFERQREEDRKRELIEERKRTQEQVQEKFERRVAKLNKWLVVASIIAIILAGIAWLKWRDAQKEATIAHSLQSATAAIANLNIDPERSVLLALQAVSLSRSVSKSVLPEAEDALHRSVQASRTELTLSGHTGRVACIAFSLDGMRLATASWDGTVKVWDAISGKELFSLSGHTAEVLSVAFSPDGKRLATASDDRTAKVWDAISGKELFSLSGHTGGVYGVAFSSDGKRLATASDDKTAKVWNPYSGKELFTLYGHAGGVYGVAFSPDGTRLATASDDKTAKVWEANSGKVLVTLSGHSRGVYGVAFSRDGTRLATASDDKTAKVWDANSGKLLVTLSGHAGGVYGVAFGPDGTRLATGSTDGTAKVWNPYSGKELFTLYGHTRGVYGVVFSPDDGTRLASASDDKTAKVWNATSVEEILTLSGHLWGVYGVAFSPDGKRLATASDDKTAKVWDANSGKELFPLSGHTGGVLSVAFSPDGRRLATASDDNTAKVWDANSRKVLVTLSGHAGGVYGVAFSPDGTRLATASDDKTAKVWDANSGKVLVTLSGHAGIVYAVAFSPDGTRLATGSGDGTAKVWDANSGKVLFPLSGHTGWVLSVAFSRDGTRLATGSGDGTAKVWDAISGKELLTLSGHTGGVLSVAFSPDPDGKRLATGSWDGTAKVWDAFSGKKILTLSGHTEGVLGVAFSPDGKRLATANWDGTVPVYALDVKDLVSLALARVTRPLTAPECEELLRLPFSREAQAIGSFVDGKNHARAGDAARAISSFDEAIKLDPNLGFEPKVEANRFAAQAFAKKANFLWQQGNHKEAYAYRKEAAYLDPEHWTLPGPEFYTELARTFWIKRDIKRAIEFVNKALEADPAYGPGLILIGNINFEREQFEDAASAFSKVKENDPKHEYAIELLGQTLFDGLFKYEEAYHAYKNAQQLYPNNKNFALDLAEANLATERFAEARKLAQELLTESGASLEKYQKVAMKFIIVSSLAMQGKTGEANDAFKDFLRYYHSVIDDRYYSSWSFKGTKHFIEKRLMDENQKRILLKLIDILEEPNRSITVKDFKEF
jgi:WD40 repeat protein/tetratricopeptide (TPR) repeat protein